MNHGPAPSVEIHTMSSPQRALFAFLIAGLMAAVYMQAGHDPRTSPARHVVLSDPQGDTAPHASSTDVDAEIEITQDFEVAVSPFEAISFNSTIGIGATAQGRFGGRFGGRRGAQERYAATPTTGFTRTADDPAVTFAADVDTGSYSNLRRMLIRERRRPPRDAVRIEELVNYFPYPDIGPSTDDPIAVNAEITICPWAPKHRLARVTVSTAAINLGNRPAANLVFLIDVSGSMSAANKLPLLKQAMRLLVDQLSGRDRVSVVVYACLLYTSPSPRDLSTSRMPSSA